MRDQKITNFHLDENKPIPGQYELDIYVNNQWRGKYDIIVADDPGSTCISTELLKNIGVISDGLQPQGATDCIALKDVVRSGGYTFNIGVFRLDLSVPQAYVNEVEAGYVLPENWDRGINAFYTSYYASQYYSDYKNSGSSESTYVRFNSGFNLLGWQAHADTTFNKTDGSSGEWKSNTLY